MPNDAFIEFQEALRRQVEPLQSVGKALQQNELMQNLSATSERHQEMMRLAYGPLEGLRQSGLVDTDAGVTGAARRLSEFMAEMESRFRLPEMVEASRLLAESPVAKVLERYQQQASDLQRTFDAMRTPWLDVHERLRSAGAFAELQGIGHALRVAPAFDARIAEALRIYLGDWQARIEWPAAIFTDPLARAAFYEERGLDPALTAFPAKAFHESLGYAGLDTPTPPLIEGYWTEAEPEPDEEEAAFARTNEAHDRLTRFETQLRRFIDEQMRAAFGESWIKHRVPGDIYTRWREKRQKALDNGEREWPLIAYADFVDYVPIITRNDNWKAVFRPVFGRQSFVQESFQRLYPIRICTMHARLITQDDELYLYVETRRILSAIGIAV